MELPKAILGSGYGSHAATSRRWGGPSRRRTERLTGWRCTFACRWRPAAKARPRVMNLGEQMRVRGSRCDERRMSQIDPAIPEATSPMMVAVPPLPGLDRPGVIITLVVQRDSNAHVVMHLMRDREP